MLLRTPDSALGVPLKAYQAPEATAPEIKATEKLRRYIEDCRMVFDALILWIVVPERSPKRKLDDENGDPFQLKFLCRWVRRAIWNA